MGSISLSVHPLFYIFGFYYALTGRIFVFVIYTVCAVLHELGHSFVATSAGYRLNKITLMPFGAVVSGNVEGLKFLDEIRIALAGPFLNLAIGLFFVAVWWIYPESYAYTDVVAEANFSMALVNFLPVFPLDGGRVLSAYLCMKVGQNRADKICKIIGVLVALFLVGGFIATAFTNLNLSLLFFALFVLFGVFGKAKENKYVRVSMDISLDALKRGLPCVRQAVDKSITVKKMVSLLSVNAVNELLVFDGAEQVALLTQKRITEIVKTGDLYSPISKYLSIKTP